ncbi:MAG: CpsB/CapC family capsule biosynthesis tyrosine phosphatase, partial [Bryocella sp.]
MVDIHHHLLPDLDDGSTSLAVSLDMARMAVADGITHVVCTPHASNHWAFEPERIMASFAELSSALDRENIPLTLGLGCDFHLSSDNVDDAFRNPTKYTINGKQYLLVELPDVLLQGGTGETLHNLRVSGIVPILTHPERNLTLQKNTDRLAAWMRDGLLVQITAGSVLGKMGRDAERTAHQLLADHWVHFLATDAHNTTSRPPQMRKAHELIAKKYGAEYAEALTIHNPAAVFSGKALPQLEPPLHLFDDEDEDEPKRPLWRRLL